MVEMAAFDFTATTKIVFGAGRVDEIGRLAGSLGRRAFLVTGGQSMAESGVLGRVVSLLEAAGCAVETFRVAGEPTVGVVSDGVARSRRWDADVVVAVGGGSVMDAAKAISGLLTNGGEVADYLEGVGAGLEIERPASPMIAVPTTAGTGAEVTKNAVITDDGHTYKKSMRSDYLLPRIALVDPMLTTSAPASVTAASGLDALTQLIESYTSNKAGPMTDALAEKGIELVAECLPKSCSDPDGVDARSGMSLAALWGGICLANAGLGAVHGFASPLGAFYPAPHGAVCAALLPHVVAANVARLCAETPSHAALGKYRRLAAMLADGPSPTPGDLVSRLGELVSSLGIPPLGRWGLSADDIPRIVANARGSSMRYNPVELTDDELTEIMEAAL